MEYNIKKYPKKFRRITRTEYDSFHEYNTYTNDNDRSYYKTGYEN